MHAWVVCVGLLHALTTCMHVLVVVRYTVAMLIRSQISVKVYKSIINIVFGYNVHTIINGVYTKCMVISSHFVYRRREDMKVLE